MDNDDIGIISYNSLIGLATDEGINASGNSEIYNCIFGRDSAITILKILRILSKDSQLNYVDKTKLLQICRRTLVTLTTLQGTAFNNESGEEPGKFIHEYRKDNFEHLIKSSTPWYLYPDGKLRNFDSVDATPLALIALFRYWIATKDEEFLMQVMPSVRSGLDWIMSFADKDADYLLEYEFSKTRKHGGLLVQSWTDSHESLRQVDGTMPVYPIAPVEVQGYAWLALKLWSDYFLSSGNQYYSEKLTNFADSMKESFNASFIIKSSNYYYTAQALDGRKNKIMTITGNALLLLWASYDNRGSTEAILDTKYIPDIVERSFLPDLFDKDAGIRTMSMDSPTYNPGCNSYHNGSFWPKLNGMAHEGLEKWGFLTQAAFLKNATLIPLKYFHTPIELYIKNNDGNFLEYQSPTGQNGCKVQAWSAAVALDLASDLTQV